MLLEVLRAFVSQPCTPLSPLPVHGLLSCPGMPAGGGVAPDSCWEGLVLASTHTWLVVRHESWEPREMAREEFQTGSQDT